MKKIMSFLLALFVILVATIGILWLAKAEVLKSILSKKLNTEVTFENLNINYSPAELSFSNLKIYNPPRSRTPIAFLCKEFSAKSTIDELTGTPLTVDSIVFNDIFITVEIYNNQNSTNNWAVLLKHDEKNSKNSRDYLIKRLNLNNINVTLVKADGSISRYPALGSMEFHNISNKTGFPLDKIEKAIMDTIMRSIFRQYGLDQLFKALDPRGMLPQLFKMPFSSEAEPEKEIQDATIQR